MPPASPRRTGEKIVESKLFGAFKLHYRSTARYCNPYSGNEKDNVENAVGFLRRNLMVPEPEAASLEGLNRTLLARCDELAAAIHWRKALPIGELFARDTAAGLELPGARFDAVRYESRKADKTGNLLIDGNTYAAGASFAGRRLTVGLRHDVIEILDEHAAPVRDWLDAAGAAQRRRLLSAVDTAAAAAGFEPAIQAAETLLRRGEQVESAALGMLARRLAQGTEPEEVNVDLRVYDGLVTAAQREPA